MSGWSQMATMVSALLKGNGTGGDHSVTSDLRCSVVCSDIFFSPVVLSNTIPAAAATSEDVLEEQRSHKVDTETIRDNLLRSRSSDEEFSGDFLDSDHEDEGNSSGNEESEPEEEDMDVLYEDSPELAEAKKKFFFTEFVQLPLQAFADDERLKLAILHENLFSHIPVHLRNQQMTDILRYPCHKCDVAEQNGPDSSQYDELLNFFMSCSEPFDEEEQSRETHRVLTEAALQNASSNTNVLLGAMADDPEVCKPAGEGDQDSNRFPPVKKWRPSLEKTRDRPVPSSSVEWSTIENGSSLLTTDPAADALHRGSPTRAPQMSTALLSTESKEDRKELTSAKPSQVEETGPSSCADLAETASLYHYCRVNDQLEQTSHLSSSDRHTDGVGPNSPLLPPARESVIETATAVTSGALYPLLK